jgi:GR25 family glycosyltransferase involved in LPS biosynthesis
MRGVIGCALSHYEIWKRIVADTTGKEFFLILEDDASLVPHFREKLIRVLEQAQLIEWDSIYLGYHMRENNRKTKPIHPDKIDHDIRIQPLQYNKTIGGTFGFIITKSFCSKILKCIEENGIKHGIDFFINTNSSKYGIKQFELVEDIIYSDWVQVTGTVDSDIQTDYNTIKFTPDKNDVQMDSTIQQNNVQAITFIPSYTLHKSVNCSDYDLKYVGEKPIDELKLICDDTPGAIGFTANGYLKYWTDDLDQIENGVDLYQKQVPRNDDSFGFIITRHINSAITNNYWQECYKCIRKFYDNKIIIIDDNSSPEFVTVIPSTFVNCSIVNSEYSKRGELLAYYYFHKLKPFSKAVIMHDSVFIQQPINFSTIDPIKFFWTAIHDFDNDNINIEFLRKMKESTKLIEFYKKKWNWAICFGTMSVVNLDFLEFIANKHNLFVLIDHIKTREDRINLERIFGCICMFNYANLEPSIFGDIGKYSEKIHNHTNLLKWDNYIKTNIQLPIVKIYTEQ